MRAYIGSIFLFAGNFAPMDWAFCRGQLLNIAEYETLFNVIGTTYGGDGESTFALPDYRGRVVAGASTDKPLGSQSEYPAAETEGHAQHTLRLNYIICLNGIYPSQS
ncbi:MAG: tail fiber protein [Bacteroidota bacterium]